MANLRLAAFVLAAVALGWGIWQGITPLIAAGLVLLTAFFVLVYRHNQLRRARDRYAGLTRLNEEAGLRLARDWDHLPARHTVTAPPGHPYAADLDLFGRASLFQLMEAVGTHLGEATLARWLLAPAPPATVAARQPAVAELAPRIDWRDELALRGRALGDPRPDPTHFSMGRGAGVAAAAARAAVRRARQRRRPLAAAPCPGSGPGRLSVLGRPGRV